MPVKKITPPPAIADVLNENGKLSKSWIDFLHSIKTYIDQASASTSTIATFTDTPAALGDAATLADLNTLRVAVNAINTKLSVS